MFESIERAKQIGILCVERIGDYLELIFVEMEIRANNIGARLLSTALSILFLFLAFIFLGFATIITFWDSENRTLAAWAVFIVYLLGGVICHILARKKRTAETPANVVLEELKEDIQLLKDIFKPR